MKLPRKLKKQLKKMKLNSHSESYKKYAKMKSSRIRISYINKERGTVAFDLIRK